MLVYILTDDFDNEEGADSKYLFLCIWFLYFYFAHINYYYTNVSYVIMYCTSTIYAYETLAKRDCLTNFWAQNGKTPTKKVSQRLLPIVSIYCSFESSNWRMENVVEKSFETSLYIFLKVVSNKWTSNKLFILSDGVKDSFTILKYNWC